MRSAAGINEPDIIFRNLVLGEDIEVDIYQRLICMSIGMRSMFAIPHMKKHGK
jgi:hypothetical protein